MIRRPTRRGGCFWSWRSRPEAAYALGLALETSGQYRATAEAFEEALRLKPGLKMAHRRLAALYRERLGDPAKAQEHSRQAAEGRER